MSVHAAHQKTNASYAGIPLKKSNQLLSRWLRSAVRAWQRRKMIAALSALDDRTLRDIGMHRGEIERVVDRFEDRELQMAPVAPEAESDDAEEYSFRKAA